MEVQKAAIAAFTFYEIRALVRFRIHCFPPGLCQWGWVTKPVLDWKYNNKNRFSFTVHLRCLTLILRFTSVAIEVWQSNSFILRFLKIEQI